jgi:hypothetical protein
VLVQRALGRVDHGLRRAEVGLADLEVDHVVPARLDLAGESLDLHHLERLDVSHPHRTCHGRIIAGARPRISAGAWPNRHRRAQLLREERDAQLLDHPAEFLQLLVDAVGVLVRLRARFVLFHRPCTVPACFWSRSAPARYFGEAQRVALEVAGQVLERSQGVRERKPG